MNIILNYEFKENWLYHCEFVFYLKDNVIKYDTVFLINNKDKIINQLINRLKITQKIIKIDVNKIIKLSKKNETA